VYVTFPREDNDLDAGAVREYGAQRFLKLNTDARRFVDEPDQIHVREHEKQYELVPGGDEDWPTYSVAESATGLKIGAKALDLLDLEPGDEVQARGDRKRGVVELYPPGAEIDAGEATVADEDDETATADGGAVAFTDYSHDDPPKSECANCGSQLSQDFAKVFTPDHEDRVRVCPNCEDKIRDGGDVREARAPRNNRSETDE